MVSRMAVIVLLGACGLVGPRCTAMAQPEAAPAAKSPPQPSAPAATPAAAAPAQLSPNGELKTADDVLAPFGITMDEFLAKGRKQFTISMFQSLCERIIATELKCDFLLFGYDNDRNPHIVHLTGNGADYVYDKPGFWAIGSGAYSALSMLFFRQQNVLTELPETFYHACEAKFMAESAIGVGKATFPYVLIPGQDPLRFDPGLIFQVRAAWEIKAKPKMPTEILNVIASTLHKNRTHRN